MNKNVAAIFTLGAFLCCVLPAPAAAQFIDQPYRDPSPDPRDLTGAYMLDETIERVRPVEGGEAPIAAWTKAVLERRLAAAKNGAPEPQPETLCFPHGTPRILTSPYPIFIYQSPRETLFVHEILHIVRHVYMNEEAPTDLDPTYMGYSVGRWEGDTLVIRTSGINDITWLDREGTPHSDQLRVTERWRKINGGKQLEISITLDDPKAFTRSFTIPPLKLNWSPQFRQIEYICTENNRDPSDLPFSNAPERPN